MSGGHFNYDQYRIRTIAETIRSIIDNNTKKDQWGYAGNYNEETLKYFERAIEILKIAEVYTQRIDWLVSGDDGEETFMKRLHKELAEIKAIPIEPLVMQKIAGIIKELEEQYDNGAPLTPYGENFKEGYLKALHHIRLKINDSNFSA